MAGLAPAITQLSPGAATKAIESTGRFVPSSLGHLCAAPPSRSSSVGVDLVVGLPRGARTGRQRLALRYLPVKGTCASGRTQDADAELRCRDLMPDIAILVGCKLRLDPTVIGYRL